LLTTFTHDTKRSADVRARLAALTWIPEEWAALVRGVGIGGEDEYHVLQTVVGAWPLESERLDAYIEKALREGKRTSSWAEPDEEAERRVKECGAALLRSEEVARFVERVRPLGRRIALGQLLLKLTSPGVPDIYQGDELEALALVDPDNRRPVDWALREGLLNDRREPKLHLTQTALALRARRPKAFAGTYEPVDLGPDVCAFVRGGEVLVVVPVRNVPLPDPGPGWRRIVGEPGFFVSE
jgi:(1->4)-alpha-D-glucan 1-alpha-D-glucosylmutase